MAKIAQPRKRWERGLPLPDAIVVMESVEPIIASSDAAEASLALEIRLVDGMKIEASSLDELRSDVADVRGNEIEDFDFYWVCPGEMLVNLSGTPPHDGAEDGKLQLGVRGGDETTTRGVFARLERTIDKAFAAIDDPPKPANGHTANISIGSITVGDGSVAISGVGDAVSSSASGPNSSARATQRQDPAPSSIPSEDRAHASPWQNIWFITIVGGALAAIIAGLILYWLLN